MLENSNNKIIEEAKTESLNLLNELKTPKGFIASSVDVDNYKRIFSRDGVVCGLASLGFDDDGLKDCFKETLLTLRRHQDKTGRIASNISLDEQKISYGTTVGRIDSTIWYIIGCCKYYLETGDVDFLKQVEDSIEKSLFYLECLELNGRGFIYVPPGGDWADEYINEGYILFDQMLYLIALDYYYKIVGNAEIQDKKKHLRQLIKINFFPHEKNLESEYVYQKQIFQNVLKKYKAPIPLSSFSAFGAHYFYDLFAISLILGSDIVPAEQKRQIEDFLKKTYEDLPIYPAFYPTIDNKSVNWPDLKSNYLFRFKNQPGEYHNGGLWPMVHGFYLNSKTDLGEEELSEFASIIKRDKYIFPEFYHGRTLEGLGTKKLGFSAAGYLLAYQRFVNDDRIFEL